jgi:hypothetical protein
VKFLLRFDPAPEEKFRSGIEGQDQGDVGIEKDAGSLLDCTANGVGQARVIIVLIKADALHVVLRQRGKEVGACKAQRGILLNKLYGQVLS